MNEIVEDFYKMKIGFKFVKKEREIIK